MDGLILVLLMLPAANLPAGRRQAVRMLFAISAKVLVNINSHQIDEQIVIFSCNGLENTLPMLSGRDLITFLLIIIRTYNFP